MLLVLLLTIARCQYLQLLFSIKPCRWSEAPGCRCCSCWRRAEGRGRREDGPGSAVALVPALRKPRLAPRTSRHFGPRDPAPRRGGEAAGARGRGWSCRTSAEKRTASVAPLNREADPAPPPVSGAISLTPPRPV